MKDDLTNFNKTCPICKEVKPISKFRDSKRKCHYCYECRQIMYIRCDICGYRKRRVEMKKIETVSSICKKCSFDKADHQDQQFNNAFNILDNLKEKGNVLHTNKSA